eukprot:1381612-Rhodomonas_salina.1
MQRDGTDAAWATHPPTSAPPIASQGMTYVESSSGIAYGTVCSTGVVSAPLVAHPGSAVRHVSSADGACLRRKARMSAADTA